MKTINEPFTDEEFAQLLEFKGEMTWHEFIMSLVKNIKLERKADLNV
jgi:hypothetical protein